MYNDILVPIDLADAEFSAEILGTANEYAKLYNARLHVMSVVPDFGMSIVGSYFKSDQENEFLQHASQQLHEFAATHVAPGIPTQHIVAHGSIYGEIIRTSEKLDVDLIVIGAHRPTLGEFLLGANAARVARHAKCSVMICRQKIPKD